MNLPDCYAGGPSQPYMGEDRGITFDAPTYERLRAIEEAARAYVEADPDRVDMGPLYDALEQAVGR